MTSTFALIKSGNEISTRCPGVNRNFLKANCPFLRPTPRAFSHFRGGDGCWRVWSRRNVDRWESRRQLTCHPPTKIGMLPFEPRPPQISRDKSGLTHLTLVRHGQSPNVDYTVVRWVTYFPDNQRYSCTMCCSCFSSLRPSRASFANTLILTPSSPSTSRSTMARSSWGYVVRFSVSTPISPS